jgi:glucan biosynthesis protein C
MLLLVPDHATGILASNGSPGTWAIGFYWFIHIFRLPLFFAMSGFFLALLLSRKGVRTTLRNRTVRIVVPLVVGIFTVVPLFFAIAHAGEVALPGLTTEQTAGFHLDLSFLWFLWYLLIIDAVAFAAFRLAPGLVRRGGTALAWALSRPALGIPLLALPTVLTLWSDPSWTIVPGPGFTPELDTLAYYGLFFCLGATLYAHRELVAAAARNAWSWLAGALLVSIAGWQLFNLQGDPVAAQAWVHPAALLANAVATWMSVIALVGLATRYLVKPRARVRYIADSSYWIYLSHLPAMAAIAGVVVVASISLPAKFFVLTVGSLAFSLITYPLFVRHTVIGRTLNGPRPRDRVWLPKPAVTPPEAAAGPRA